MDMTLPSKSYFSSVLQPSLTNSSTAKSSTFVHKLYNMVADEHFQHLIAWNYTGASFIVCNIMEFARDVLPKHFKHNNFSSFVRQLNMYGFHKVNKSPRGHRTLAENQIWEFSHNKFLKNHPELLDDIKRKTMESDVVRRETDLQAHLAVLQVSQTDMLQQINHLYDSFNQIYKELHETKQRQQDHQKLVKNVMGYLAHQNGGQLPHEIESKKLALNELDRQSLTPSIFVTSHAPPSSSSEQPILLSQTPSTTQHTPYLETSTARQPISLFDILRSPTPTRATLNRDFHFSTTRNG
ncbi:Heat shock factor protein [Choanephora cucurbitarum]|uniref:Heat shock factor protein n=1 Tax=Choanephora cucurbitarum TaxID=101091 RepID=A0A1C7N8R4_9FUNG|nr:Heat shock factor protein [Choanephora cucurbitarum]